MPSERCSCFWSSTVFLVLPRHLQSCTLCRTSQRQSTSGRSLPTWIGHQCKSKVPDDILAVWCAVETLLPKLAALASAYNMLPVFSVDFKWSFLKGAFLRVGQDLPLLLWCSVLIDTLQVSWQDWQHCRGSKTQTAISRHKSHAGCLSSSMEPCNCKVTFVIFNHRPVANSANFQGNIEVLQKWQIPQLGSKLRDTQKTVVPTHDKILTSS